MITATATPPAGKTAAATYHPEIRTLGDAPRFHGQSRGDATAFIFGDRHTSYADFDRHTARVANGLAAQGLGPRSRIAYLGKNSDFYFELLFGAFRLGAVMVPVNWRLAKPEIVHIIADAEAEILFTDDFCAPSVHDIADQLTGIRLIIATGEGANGWIQYETWRDGQSAEDRPSAIDPGDVAVQLYTSGTTGLPKGVQLSHQAFYAFNEMAASEPSSFGADMDWNMWTADDMSMVALPAFHISGTGWGVVGVYVGATNVVLPEFVNADVIDAIRRFKVTKTALVPATIDMIVNHPDLRPEDFGSMKQFLYGAAPIPLPLLEQALAVFDCGFVQMYGLTETCGAVTYLPPEDHVPGNPNLASAGKPLPGVDVKIVGPDSDTPLPTGEIGEICLRTPAIMRGYWKQESETGRVMDDDGWFRSGDAGSLSEDGYLFIRDRVKDMIVSGGENVYPAEVEAALRGHPDIADVSVIGIPDPKWGEAVKAVVVLTLGAKPDPAGIIAYARERIAGYKLPKSVDFLDALPRNASGKVLKRELRAAYWAGRDRQVN
ncbi:long-chain-fatty-acid--CoA ligase [Parasphingopyxis marina]|uniref:3-methylmercaptopropionyl-CoA ligase n=1 Tax=Parasphingopyxis marina TaxID=2761622 RepID=A0A842HXP9_9SPHN|nr:long-chain-fatty-acid--CoA ligase [Parasphingopyxis marina]MBC2778938.1 long-chain-fatty-acid--CoA ligase [Parasphingopyxis marina]